MRNILRVFQCVGTRVQVLSSNPTYTYLLTMTTLGRSFGPSFSFLICEKGLIALTPENVEDAQNTQVAPKISQVGRPGPLPQSVCFKKHQTLSKDNLFNTWC